MIQSNVLVAGYRSQLYGAGLGAREARSGVFGRSNPMVELAPEKSHPLS
jgi:hypothetical protein